MALYIQKKNRHPVLDYIYYVIGIVHYHMNWPAIQIVDLWLLRSQRKIRIHTNINIATTDQQTNSIVKTLIRHPPHPSFTTPISIAPSYPVQYDTILLPPTPQTQLAKEEKKVLRHKFVENFDIP